MTALLEAPGTVQVNEPERRRWNRADSIVGLCYLLAAFVIYAGLWGNLSSGYLYNSAQDQNMWEWFFSTTAHSVWHLQNPLESVLQNYPDGVNMMANTAMLGLSIPLSPITMLFGPTVTWAIALTGGLAGTSFAWYWVFSRHLVTSRVAAAVGGVFCGFAPPMISHGNAHPNFAVLVLLPFIVLRLIRLAQGARPVRDGLILGVLLAYQVFLGEEPLLITMLGFVVFAIAYAASRWREAVKMVRPMVIGLVIAGVLTLVVTIFPLWWQFLGPQSYHTLEHGSVGNDTAAFTRFATESIAGDAQAAADVSMNRTEENAFFGWPLIVFMVVLTVWLWRNVLARSIAISMFVMAWLSLGLEITVAHHDTGIPGPWQLLAKLPLFDSLLESRLAMACIPAIGALLAIATERVFRAAPSFRDKDLPLRWLWLGALVAVLLPIAPTPLETITRPGTPAFFSDGTWRQYVTSGSVVTVPLPNPGDARALHWQVQADVGFPLADGYFVGPNGPDDKRGRYGAPDHPTASLLNDVHDTGDVPAVTDTQRAEALADLRYWHADVVVLAPGTNQQALQATVELLLRTPARYVDGVWLWDVRALTANAT
ncbi:glycosyl transferase [Amycolatopsis acidiphila]|uniref:Glycosyl transferase n=1 Tax=Amycolatopsis acidiphila TaxID=715473 RepID=A0A558A685_9PSEU|nr:glycosyl transferase [Amycolatopsis acidiphila]TVT19779.1 glycosyl transferase [Amycolatopsis acidiphila]UIJ61854.1 glycosyl transferase [Amycolatopsis acidiphila]GHG57547.1 glycosyl transferase [Amycolatopsis acidiphila]